ncbi:MAG: thioesterase [Oceanospirillaceae bacterium]|mgnify:CR=1 FL=1|nr:thioesterase [Oceanospirillaceae bacterium]MBT12685.1 thioesterase [Oceanospirillaceae bacterium]|tara:strand:+ start:75989 stop:76561 length:573 start_codon:yes stop_codon:yes gene_type:complete
MFSVVQLLRNLGLLARRPWRHRRPVLSPFYYRLRVMPWDCDLNLHLTNTRYPAWLDLARTDFFLRTGTMPLFIKAGWRSVLASQTLTFIREIKPLAQVDIESRVLHWDKKYFYMEHRFLVQGELHASCLARIAVLKKGRLQSLGNMMQAVARWHNEQAGELESPQAPQEVVAKIALLSAKKEAAQNRLLS